MSFLDDYRKSHTHPVNRLTHTVGIPMIVVSVVMAIASFWLPMPFWWSVGLFVLGWILQFIGHAFEGKPPAFFKNPAYLLIGVIWWARKVLGLEKK